MREGIRDVLILMGVVFAGIQVYEGRNNLPPHPIVWPIIIAALFIIAGLLNVAPIVLRSLSRKTGKDKLDAGDPFNNPQWETISNREFRNEAVELDGKRFYSCRFINTRLVFHGKAPCELIGECRVGGSVVLETDNQPAMHYAHLMRIISSIPHIGEAFLSVDDKGNARPIVNEATIEKSQPGLRERTFNLCKQLKVFLDDYQDINDKDEFARRYNSEIQPWDNKFRAIYWRRFRDQVVNMRHEYAESHLTDGDLDACLAEAETGSLGYSTVSAINEKLRHLGSKLDD